MLQRLAEFGRGYDASNLYKMWQFHAAFPNLDALRPELSWTHYRLVLPTEDELRAELNREMQVLSREKALLEKPAKARGR